MGGGVNLDANSDVCAKFRGNRLQNKIFHSDLGLTTVCQSLAAALELIYPSTPDRQQTDKILAIWCNVIFGSVYYRSGVGHVSVTEI